MKRTLQIVAVNVAVFYIVAELAALGIFYYQHGWLFYIDPYREPIPLIQEPAGQGLTAVGTKVVVEATRTDDTLAPAR